MNFVSCAMATENNAAASAATKIIFFKRVLLISSCYVLRGVYGLFGLSACKTEGAARRTRIIISPENKFKRHNTVNLGLSCSMENFLPRSTTLPPRY